MKIKWMDSDKVVIPGFLQLGKAIVVGTSAFLIPAQPGIGFPSANTSALQLPSRTPLSINREFSVT